MYISLMQLKHPLPLSSFDSWVTKDWHQGPDYPGKSEEDVKAWTLKNLGGTALRMQREGRGGDSLPVLHGGFLKWGVPPKSSKIRPFWY